MIRVGDIIRDDDKVYFVTIIDKCTPGWMALSIMGASDDRWMWVRTDLLPQPIMGLKDWERLHKI